MPKWEYAQQRSTFMDIGHRLKSQKGQGLDPEFSVSEWMAMTWKHNGKDYCRVVESGRGCWTRSDKMLAEMGDVGWELVGTTPALDMPAAGGGAGFNWYTHYPDFLYVFKRPKA